MSDTDDYDASSDMEAMIEALGIEAPSTEVNVSLLSEPELSKRLTHVTQDLLNRGEVLKPTTETGRDLHSERSAYILELRKRGFR